MYKRQAYLLLYAAILPLLVSSCNYYKQDILFKTDKGEINGDAFQAELSKAKENYVVAPNDWISFQVFTNEGEMLIDPNKELARELMGGGGGAGTMNQTMRMQQQMGGNGGGIGGGFIGGYQYLVRPSGKVYLPMVGDLYVKGSTYRELDSLLSESYEKFYEDCFVLSRITNRRVLLVSNGSDGNTQSAIIQLTNENTSLIEIISMSGGIGRFARANRIRIIRGDLKNPTVKIVDLSTIQGLTASDLTIYPNDIIYVEPGRRTFFELLKDASVATSILSLATTILTVYILFSRQ